MKTVVTGAFGYSGSYLAQRLLDQGHSVMTLTNSPGRKHRFGERIRAFPFQFAEPALLEGSLKGSDVLINTYWVRFDHALFTHDQAVTNTRILFQAAVRAGVRRIIHVSITNPDANSELPYFRGKAVLEHELQQLPVSWCILRPTVLFGKEDVLVNNIAWGLRHLPVFGVFGAGDYKLQPIYVDDLAAAAVEFASSWGNRIVQAIGPETFTYRELVETVQQAIGTRKPIIEVSPGIGYWAGRLLGWWKRDVVITREEIQGLMEGRLCVDAPPLGRTALSAWLRENSATLGRQYTSEMARRRDRVNAYASQSR